MQNENETEKFSVSRARKIGFFSFISFFGRLSLARPGTQREICKEIPWGRGTQSKLEKRASEMHFLERTPLELFASLLNGKSRENVRTHMRAPTPGTKQHFSEHDSPSLPTTAFGALAQCGANSIWRDEQLSVVVWCMLLTGPEDGTQMDKYLMKKRRGRNGKHEKGRARNCSFRCSQVTMEINCQSGLIRINFHSLCRKS